jgi:uncharacterized membrane protein YfcA
MRRLPLPHLIAYVTLLIGAFAMVAAACFYFTGGYAPWWLFFLLVGTIAGGWIVAALHSRKSEHREKR